MEKIIDTLANEFSEELFKYAIEMYAAKGDISFDESFKEAAYHFFKKNHDSNYQIPKIEKGNSGNRSKVAKIHFFKAPNGKIKFKVDGIVYCTKARMQINNFGYLGLDDSVLNKMVNIKNSLIEDIIKGKEIVITTDITKLGYDSCDYVIN